MKVNTAINLMNRYGKDTTLGELVKKIQGNKIYKCPKCGGRGYISKRYNAYPPYLPDSGWVEDWKWKEIDCDLCKGEGYTEHEYKPRIVQDGWE